MSDPTTDRGEWRAVESPTDRTLLAVTETAAGPVAVGEGGLVLARDESGWHPLVEAGPATRGNRLTCVAATADRNRVWFAGDSGALGRYDTEAGRKEDFSAPMGKTSTWEALAVAGTDTERLSVANGSGEVLPIECDAHGCPSYGDVTKPAGGSTIAALAADGSSLYAADTSGTVLERVDGSWHRIGIENAEVNFFDLSAAGGSLLVAGGDGRLYRYDRPCRNWTPVAVGEATVHGLARPAGSDDGAVAVGAGGTIHERTPDRGWCRLDSPVEADLLAVACGTTDVAVGADGTIIER